VGLEHDENGQLTADQRQASSIGSFQAGASHKLLRFSTANTKILGVFSFYAPNIREKAESRLVL
jgi:hypothetical protein